MRRANSFEFSLQSLRCNIAPGINQRSPDCVLFGGRKANVGSPALPPRATARIKYFRVVSHKRLLLLWCQLDHAPLFIGIGKRREDLVAHPEVGMVHMRALGCFRQAEGNPTKLI